jgi:hypothetical protein
MPRIPTDYSKTIIYKLVCNDLSITDVYIGSTTSYRDRKYHHKSVCNNPKNKEYNQKKYITIRANGGWDAWSMIELEKYSCCDNNEARARERYWFELINANMNSQKPFITEEEKIKYKKEYKELNEFVINEKKKKYYELNKTVLSEKQKKYNVLNKTVLSEKQKKYYELNKYVVNKKHKEYYELNKENLKEKTKCLCGGCFSYRDKQRHYRTKKHQCYLAQIKENHLENEK